MEFRVLGPLEVREGGRSLPLGGAKQRALLALLVLNPNPVVSRERSIDGLWGEDPPESAVASVQVYVSRLRKLLGPERLVTRTPGYLLEVAPGQLDLQQFERLRTAGRPDKALALWRGPPLAELPEPFARTEAARLEDLRLATLEERTDWDLERGKHADLVGELETLIAEHPHRERLRAQLMLALYRSGRQAEALEAYRRARAALDELGIEPSVYAQESVALARGVDYPHAVGRALATLGRIDIEAGHLERAVPVVDELVTMLDKTGAALRWRGFIDFAWLVHDLGRPERPPLIPYPAWSEPAQAIARGELVTAVELFAATELRTEEAFARLRAAEQLASEGRHAEAQVHAEHAAEFYSSVGGTAYLERALAANRMKVKT